MKTQRLSRSHLLYGEDSPSICSDRSPKRTVLVPDTCMTCVSIVLEDRENTIKLLQAALNAALAVHEKSEHQRWFGFPRADSQEHYCTADNRAWPCPTPQAVKAALEGGVDHD